jgi:DNA-binding transcriptional MocR family regulator
VRDFYRGKRATLLAALASHFSGRATWTTADGGLFTFVTLGERGVNAQSIDTATFVPQAVARGVAFIPGGPFFVDGSGSNTMRLTFAKETDERITEGIAKLAEVFA